VLFASFSVIVVVLAAVFVLLSWQTQRRLTRAIVDTLESGQRRFGDLEARRKREQLLQAANLAENSTLKAAVDTYHVERLGGAPVNQLLGTIQGELVKMQRIIEVPAIVVTDARGAVLANAGPFGGDWSSGDQLTPEVGVRPAEAIITRGERVYLATVVPLLVENARIGTILLALPLDDAYARTLAAEARTEVAILMDRRVIASSLEAPLRTALERAELPLSGSTVLEDEEFVVRRLSVVGSADVFALSSVSAMAQPATREAALVLLLVGGIAFALALVASWWLARTLAAPIDELRQSLAQMARQRDLERPLPRRGSSRELDDLADTFDDLRHALSAAEADSEATYLGVIGALAAALDARDPYTAGHSERVANLSVAVGARMELSAEDLETLRLGALLHDIGKIGVSDAVLRKPGSLSPEESEQIRRHPILGARILRPLPFLAAHLPIVELHHEQPDGRGYPYGLTGDQIPLLAHIVHVVDAFDAITSARAYRPARPAIEAMSELWRHTGTLFDERVVRAMAAMPVSTLAQPPTVVAAHGDEEPAAGMLVPFRHRPPGDSRRVFAG
jgi:putative nucleotidyltransferase with HDIG domain